MHFILLVTILTHWLAPLAQPGVDFGSNKALLEFPNSITFSMTAKSDAEISSVVLYYGNRQDTCGQVEAIAYPVFTPGNSIQTEWKWDMRQSGSLPPGTEIWWQWRITTADDKQINSERQTVIWLDDTHPWETKTQDEIRLHSYNLSSQQSAELLSTANLVLDRLSKQTGITAQDPIDIYIYANSSEMQEAILYEAGWTGGLAYSGFNIVLIGISQDQLEWGKRTIAHEITHVLVGDFSFSCLGDIPTWLSEGLAMVGEGGPEPYALKAFGQAIQSDTLLPFQVLSGGFSENPDKADLSYTQSHSMVDYLLKHAGQQKMNQFLTELARGAELDQALEDVYAYNLATFEAAWRVAIDASSSAQNTEVRPTPSPTWIPTIQPFSPREMQSTPVVNQIVSSSPTPSPTTAKSTSPLPVTLLAILMGCCGILGVIMIAGLTFLIANDRSKKRKILSILAFALTTGLWISFSNRVVYSQSEQPTSMPMLATATAYQPADDRPGEYINEEFGFSLRLPKAVQTKLPSADDATLLYFQIDTNTVLGALYAAPKSAGSSLEQAAKDFTQSSFTGLAKITILEDKAITLPAGISAWFTLADGELIDYQQSIRIGQTIIAQNGQVIALQMYADPSNYTYYEPQITELLHSFEVFQPLIHGYPRNQVLRLEGGESSNPRENDPATAHGGGDSLVFSGLLQNSPDLQPVPDLADRWTISPDGLTYTFHIQPNARFHNGRPVTAQDVLYSWERALDDLTSSDVALTYLGDMDGAAQMHNGAADHISGLKILDEKTLQVRLTAPKQTFLQKLTFPTTFILDRENIAQGSDWYFTPNGTGPYKLVRWESMHEQVYERFEDYYGAKPAIPAIVVSLFSGDSTRLYESNQIDLSPIGSYNVDRFSDPAEPMHAELHSAVDLCTSYITFDVNQPPFDDLQVRKAFSAALDKNKYIQVVLSGSALEAKGLYPPALPGYDRSTTGISFDPTIARKWLAESSYPLEKIPEIVFSTSGYGSSVSSSVAAWIQMWEQNLGVKIVVQNIEPDLYQQVITSGQHGQLLSQGWCADYPDPENFSAPLFGSQSALNIGNYHNPQLDALLEEASITTDMQKRIALYQQAERMILADAPAVFTTHPISYTLVKPYIRGYFSAPIAMPLEKYLSIDPNLLYQP